MDCAFQSVDFVELAVDVCWEVEMKIREPSLESEIKPVLCY